MSHKRTKFQTNWHIPQIFACSLTHSIICTGVLLLLSHFSRVQLCATPQTAAHQAPPSLGFSRQEHWSGLPFPSQKHESEKWKWSCSVVSDSSWPHGLQPTRLLCRWDFPGKSTGVGRHCLLHAKYCLGTWTKYRSLSLWRLHAVRGTVKTSNKHKWKC